VVFDSLSLTDMNDKTAAEKLQGYWLIEIGELAGMRKADIDKVKAFISRQDDKYRASSAGASRRIRGSACSLEPPTRTRGTSGTSRGTGGSGRSGRPAGARGAPGS
jgi:hypothetical protein